MKINSITAEKNCFEVDFDTINKMYTVSGIFPSFTLKYNEAELDVSRVDNDTKGEY